MILGKWGADLVIFKVSFICRSVYHPHLMVSFFSCSFRIFVWTRRFSSSCGATQSWRKFQKSWWTTAGFLWCLTWFFLKTKHFRHPACHILQKNPSTITPDFVWAYGLTRSLLSLASLNIWIKSALLLKSSNWSFTSWPLLSFPPFFGVVKRLRRCSKAASVNTFPLTTIRPLSSTSTCSSWKSTKGMNENDTINFENLPGVPYHFESWAKRFSSKPTQW